MKRQARRKPLGPARLPDGFPAPPYGQGEQNFRPFRTKPVPRLCACGEPAVVIALGTERFYEPALNEHGVTIIKITVEEEDDRDFCIACAHANGWPWGLTSETDHRNGGCDGANGDGRRGDAARNVRT